MSNSQALPAKVRDQLGDLAKTAELVRQTVTTAVGALKEMNVGSSDDIAMVLRRHADDSLAGIVEELSQLSADPAEVEGASQGSQP
jgi:hypothetical protein